MPLNFTVKKALLYKIGLLIFAGTLLGACSIINVSYISREELKSASFAPEMPRYIEKKPLSLGGIRLLRADAKKGEMGQVIMLQRRKGVYMAETKVFDTGKKRAFISVGLDHRTKTPAFHFRMEF